MRPGEVLGGRFEIERRASSGGMGEVFLGRDRTTGEAVAVKVLLAGRAHDSARLAREAEVLSALSHPGIVRYVGHGAAATGEPYLAMEWLSGEDLASRLGRGALTAEETVALGLSVASALGAAHARGVVHRDLKPSNLFLVEGDVRRVKVLDFGIARRPGATRMTQTGAVLGTPEYMAPEQVQSGGGIDARADVFALGCVLFECVAGEPLFTGEHVMAVLAKILFQEAPRLSEQRAEVPPGLSALVARMLSKERDERPRDGRAVAEALRALGSVAAWTVEHASLPPSAPPSGLTGSERRVLSVVLVGARAASPPETAPTLDEAEVTAEARALREVVEASGGHLTLLADGAAIVTVRSSSRVATDQAAQAARVALSLRALIGQRPIALSTGQAEVTGRLPEGDAIDRAAQMLAKLASASPGAREPGARPIAIDEVTAGLLDARFEVAESAGSFELRVEREVAEGARTLLGKPTACVGRDWELGTIEGLLTASVEEPMARAVLVTAPAGMGKSRLAHELMERVRRRGDGTAVWLGRGDSLRAGATFGLLGQALRSTLGIHEGEPLEARRHKLRTRVGEHVPAQDQRRVAEFLGELVGTPLPEEESVPLRAARQDAQLMGDQMCKAWVDFLQAETAAHPVLLVLEDLHWGDLSTVRFIDAALRDMGAQPWMVLALARPEVNELFPRLWAERQMQEIRLKELPRKAGERLVRQVLGDSADSATVERLVVQAEGNAFYLEELIRAVAESKGGALPETVLAMVEARLAGLPGEARRVLRAASVFGEVCWQGGVSALLGSSLRLEKPAEQWLQLLVEREVLVRRPESRFRGELEFAFRHALLREGSYAMLTSEDRALGHRLAGRWLEQHGDADPIVLAKHFQLGGDSARAGDFYLRAAEQALRAGEGPTTIAHIHLGLDCAVSDDVRIVLLGTLCEAYGWHIHTVISVLPHADELLRLAPRGSVPWAQGVFAKLTATMSAGMLEEFQVTLQALQETEPAPDAAGPLALPFCAGVYLLESLGRSREADALMDRFSTIARAFAARQPLVPAWWNLLMAWRQAYAKEEPYRALDHADTARSLAEMFNDGRIILTAQVFRAMNLWFLGVLESASRALGEARGADAALGIASSVRRFCLAWTLGDLGALDRAYLVAHELIAVAQSQQLALDEGRGRWALAEVLRRAGDLDRADKEIHAALALLSAASPLDHPGVLSTLAALRLAQGRPGEALGAAEEALARYEEMGACGFFRGAFLRLVHAEALEAAGEQERARAAIGVARDRLLANAAKIGEPGYRKSFLEAVPENARTLALASAWLGEGAARS